MLNYHAESETEWLLLNLWKDIGLGSLPFIIPDTIIYKYGKPQSWYFTAKNGLLKRKIKRNITYENIRECLYTKKQEFHNIVASSYCFNETKEAINIIFEHIPLSELGSIDIINR